MYGTVNVTGVLVVVVWFVMVPRNGRLLVVSIAPVTLGAGAPLLPRHVELTRTEWAVNGEFVCVRYDVVREPA